MLFEEGEAGHQHAGRAVAALQAVLLVEGLLQRVQHAALLQALDRQHLGAVALHRQHGARLDRHAVEIHRACPAVRGFAADVRTGVQQLLAQHRALGLVLDAAADADVAVPAGFTAEGFREAVGAGLALPPGYHIQWSGQFEFMERVREKLALMIPVALMIIVLLLYRRGDCGRHASYQSVAHQFIRGECRDSRDGRATGKA